MKTNSAEDIRTNPGAFLRRRPWLTSAAALVVLAAIFYMANEWHAEYRWQRYAAEARARGTQLHFADFTRAEIPDAENFLALPVLQIPLAKEKQDARFVLPLRPRPKDRAKLATFNDTPPSVSSRRKIDWKEWQQYFLSVGFITEASDDPVRDVLRALEHYAPHFQQWSEWRTTRSRSQPPRDREKARTVSANIATASAVLYLRMHAHLAIGDSAAAYADFQDGMRAPHALREDPSGASGVLRRGMFRSLVESVGVGLSTHSWAAPELPKLEADLAAISLWDDYCLTMAGARCDYNVDIEERMNTSVRGRIANASDLLNENASRAETLLEMFTRSLFRDNELRLNRHFDEMTVRGGEAEHGFNPNRPTPSAPGNLTSTFAKDYYWLGGQSGGFSEMEDGYMVLQILFDQARLACALERAYLARGVYPATLTELVPEFVPVLPHDPYSRAPYHYRPVGKDSFLLYSVGKNRNDDGGKSTPTENDFEQPDLVWKHAPMPTNP